MTATELLQKEIGERINKAVTQAVQEWQDEKKRAVLDAVATKIRQRAEVYGPALEAIFRELADDVQGMELDV